MLQVTVSVRGQSRGSNPNPFNPQHDAVSSLFT